MATTSPPSPPSAPPPPPSGSSPSTPPSRSRRADIGRILAASALALVVLIVAYLLFGGGGGSNYKLEFADAGQLVRGDQVLVGGVPVGQVKDIELTKNFKAVVTIHIDSSLVPLHQGTTAQVRVPGIAGVANRYIALSLGPNNNPSLPAGSKLPVSATKEVTDIDQLFNIFNPKTVKGLQQFLQGSAEQYVGSGKQLGESTELFAPALSATEHFFAELTRDEPTFTNFLVETAKAVTTIGARKDQLSELIEHQNTTFQALGANQEALTRGLKQLPVTLRQGNQTFAELPSTLAALTTLVNASRPTNPSLLLLFERLEPLLKTATPVVHNFSQAFSKPGANNDLTDLVRALPALAQTLSTASPAGVVALKETVPISAFFGPYSPDLAGTLRTFGGSGAYYDADGHYVRVNPVFPDFKLGENNTLKPTSPTGALEGIKSGQLRRCPGTATAPAADGSSPFTDNGQLSCDPSETP